MKKKFRQLGAILVIVMLCMSMMIPYASAAYTIPDASPSMLYQAVSDKTGVTADGDTLVRYGYITSNEKAFFDKYDCVTYVVAWRILFQVYGIQYYPAAYYPDTAPLKDTSSIYADASVAAILLRLAVPTAQANLRMNETEFKRLLYALDNGQYQALPEPTIPSTTVNKPVTSPNGSGTTVTNPGNTTTKPGNTTTPSVTADKLISTQVYDRKAYNQYYNTVLAALQNLPSSWIDDFYNSGWKIVFKWQISDPNSTAAKKLNGNSGLTSYADKTIYIGSYNAKTIAHEFTHYAAWRVGWRTEYLTYYYDTESYGVIDILPAYAQTNAVEYFADFGAYWLVYPDTHESLAYEAPNTADRVKSLIADYATLLPKT